MSADIANTGGWQAWQTMELGQIEVSENSNANDSIRLDAAGSRFNINWLEFERIDTLAGNEASTSIQTDLALISAMARFAADDDAVIDQKGSLVVPTASITGSSLC